MSTPGEPSPFGWRCGSTEEHEHHRIEGDGYYGPAGYICDGQPPGHGHAAIHNGQVPDPATALAAAVHNLGAAEQMLSAVDLAEYSTNTVGVATLHAAVAAAQAQIACALSLRAQSAGGEPR